MMTSTRLTILSALLRILEGYESGSVTLELDDTDAPSRVARQPGEGRKNALHVASRSHKTVITKDGSRCNERLGSDKTTIADLGRPPQERSPPTRQSSLDRVVRIKLSPCTNIHRIADLQHGMIAIQYRVRP